MARACHPGSHQERGTAEREGLLHGNEDEDHHGREVAGASNGSAQMNIKNIESAITADLRHYDARFFYKTRTLPNGCLDWIAAKNGAYGYGRFHLKKHAMLAHRVSWVISNGPIQPGLSVLHKCDRPSCVNPNHLFLGTQAENMADMISKGRIGRRDGSGLCGENHPFAKINNKIVRKIREARSSGIKYKFLSDKFGLSISQLCQISNGNAWKGV